MLGMKTGNGPSIIFLGGRVTRGVVVQLYYCISERCGMACTAMRIPRLGVAKDPNGRWRVDLDLRRDADEREPAAWQRVKRLLAEHEFVLADGMGLGDGEMFLPSSFFSADIALCATRVYGDLPSALCGLHAIENCLFRSDGFARATVGGKTGGFSVFPPAR